MLGLKLVKHRQYKTHMAPVSYTNGSDKRFENASSSQSASVPVKYLRLCVCNFISIVETMTVLNKP